MNNRRRSDRHQLLFNARVHDAARGGILGHLSNLSAHGLMVVTERPLRVDRSYRVRIPLPITVDGQRALEAETIVAWSERAIHPAYFRNGLHVRALDEQQRHLLDRLVEGYALRFGDQDAVREA